MDPVYQLMALLLMLGKRLRGPCQRWLLLKRVIHVDINIGGQMKTLTKLARAPILMLQSTLTFTQNKGLKNENSPRELFSSERKANAAFAAIDQSLRFQQRAVSHVSLIMSVLSKGLEGESENPDYILSQLLWGLAKAIVDVGDMSVSASARCVLAIRNINIDAMNILD